MKTIVLTLGAAKDLDALPEAARQAILAALHGYATTASGDVKTLAGGGSRMRVGAYRIIFDEDRTTILAIAIGRRSTRTYKR